MKFSSAFNRYQFYLWSGLAWLLLWIFSAFMTHEETFVPQVLNEVWRAVFITGVHLLFFEWSVPYIIKKRKMIYVNFLAGILFTGLHFILLSFGLYGWKVLGVQCQIYTILRHVSIVPDTAYQRMMEDVLFQAQGGFSSFIFFGLSKLLYDNYRLKQVTQQLLLEKKEAELNYLKSQTNPHFLFNTLNNIYSLAIEKSDQTQESILRLSSILRFMLYETSEKFISLEQEIAIVNDYIALEKLRYDDSLKVNFVYDIDDKEQKLPPLMLIPLVENAFKHGVSESSHLPFVDIHLSVQNNQLCFKVKNSNEYSGEEKMMKENIGLTNVKKQLQLLYTDYDLSFHSVDSVFVVTLKINLTSHV
ncbi:MAG: histidine kinase [Saprospiraceae bacterium]|nr:histidine kinase [Saprospiraceae bacterium]